MIAGNYIVLDFQTATNYLNVEDQNQRYGFACSVTGYPASFLNKHPLEHLERELTLVAGACASYLIEASLSTQEGTEENAAAIAHDLENPFLKLSIESCANGNVSVPNSAPTSPAISSPAPKPKANQDSPSSTPLASPREQDAAPTVDITIPPAGWIKSITLPANHLQFLIDFIGPLPKDEPEAVPEKEEEEEEDEERETKKKNKKGKSPKRSHRRRDSKKEDAKSEASGSSKEKAPPKIAVPPPEEKTEPVPDLPQAGSGPGLALATFLSTALLNSISKDVPPPKEEEQKKPEEKEEKEVKKATPKKGGKKGRGKAAAIKGKGKGKGKAKSKKKKAESDEDNSEEAESEAESEEDNEEPKAEAEKEEKKEEEEEEGDFGLFEMFDDDEATLAKTKLSTLVSDSKGLLAMRTTFVAALYPHIFC